MLPHDPLWGPYHISLQSQVAVPNISFYQPGEIQLWIAPLARLPHTSSDGKSGTTRPILSKDTVQWYSQGWQISSSATLHQGTVCQWRSEQLPLPTWQKVDHQHSFWNLGGKFVAFFMCETPNGFVTQLGGSSKEPQAMSVNWESSHPSSSFMSWDPAQFAISSRIDITTMKSNTYRGIVSKSLPLT